MGLRSWAGDVVRKADVTVSKNYLAPSELRELNRLTTILLDIFEDQLDLGRLIIMQDTQTLLERQLQQLGRTVLRSGGTVKTADAHRLAEEQYERFDHARKLRRQQEADAAISALAREAKKLPNTSRSGSSKTRREE